MLRWKLQYFGHLMRRADSLEKTLRLGKIGGKRTRQKEMEAAEKEIVSATDLMNMNLSKLLEIVEEREAWFAAVHVIAGLDMTE